MIQKKDFFKTQAGISQLISQNSMDRFMQVPGGSVGLTTIIAHPTLSTGLQHYYDFDTNGSFNDLVGSRNLLIAGAAFNASGKIGGAYTFDGLNDFIGDTASSTVGIANAWSVSFWVKPGVDTTLQYLFETRNFNIDLNNSIGIRKRATTENIRILLYDSSATFFKDYISTNALSISSYTHIVVTWDGTNLKLYINGTEDTTVTKNLDNAGTMIDTARRITLGNNTTSSGVNWYKGDQDELAIYSKAVTSSEVTDLFNSNNGLPYN